MEYIQYIKSVPSEEGRQGELALFRRQVDEAERIFLQASPPLVYRAIKMNLRQFRWGRALDLAVKHRSHIDTVLAYRQKHLTEFEKSETNQRFIQIAGQVSFSNCQFWHVGKPFSSTPLFSCARSLLTGRPSALRSNRSLKMNPSEVPVPVQPLVAEAGESNFPSDLQLFCFFAEWNCLMFSYLVDNKFVSTIVTNRKK